MISSARRYKGHKELYKELFLFHYEYKEVNTDDSLLSLILLLLSFFIIIIIFWAPIPYRWQARHGLD